MPFGSPPDLPTWLVKHLPVRRRAYTLERGVDAGKTLHLLDAGPETGPVVFLMHGNPTWSFLWRKVIAALPGFRCVAPDMLGLGFSDRLPHLADHQLDRHVDALAELVEALDLKDAIMVGQDWGGPMVAGVGARHPDRFTGAVFANTSVLAPRRPRGTAYHRFARIPLLSDLVFRGLGFPQRTLFLPQGDRGSIRGEILRAYNFPLRRMRDRIAPLALARMVPSSPDHPSMDPLRRGEEFVTSGRLTVALVWGMRDPILARALRRHERAFPDAPVTRTQAGHFLQEETPGALADAVSWVHDQIRARR